MAGLASNLTESASKVAESASKVADSASKGADSSPKRRKQISKGLEAKKVQEDDEDEEYEIPLKKKTR